MTMTTAVPKENKEEKEEDDNDAGFDWGDRFNCQTAPKASAVSF